MSVVVFLLPAFLDVGVLAAILAEVGIGVAAVAGKKILDEKRVEKKSKLAEAVDALKQMGYRVEEVGELKSGDQEVDLAIKTNKGYSVGLRKTPKGAYEVVAHFEEVQPTKQEASKITREIQKHIRQRYAYEKVKKEIAKHGFALAEEKVEEDNTIKLVVRKWA